METARLAMCTVVTEEVTEVNGIIKAVAILHTILA